MIKHLKQKCVQYLHRISLDNFNHEGKYDVTVIISSVSSYCSLTQLDLVEEHSIEFDCPSGIKPHYLFIFYIVNGQQSDISDSITIQKSQTVKLLFALRHFIWGGKCLNAALLLIVKLCSMIETIRTAICSLEYNTRL